MRRVPRTAPEEIREDLARLEEALDGAERIVVTTHLRPDGDAIGSEACLTAFLGDRGKTVRVINDDPTPELLRFVAPTAFPVEVYDPAVHDPVFRSADLILLVDNAAPDRLGRLEGVIADVADRVLCIDHHPSREAPWHRTIQDVGACATAAILYRLTRAAGWTPDADAARSIYVALATDTGFFRFNSTNPEAHRIAAELVESGVDPAACYRAIHERNSPQFTRLLGEALARVRLDAEGAIASVRLSAERIAALDAAGEDTTEITTAMLAIDGVQIVLLFRELSGGRVKVSLRSKARLDVHRLASEYGGGGHRNASGIVMPGALDEVADRITARAVEHWAATPAVADENA